jgi:hypothetical protein
LVERLAKALDTKSWVLLCDDRKLVLSLTSLDASDLAQRSHQRRGRPKSISRA